MPGPRDYGDATKKALFDLANGSCYYPECPEPTIVFVEGHPATNLDIAHIRGARRGSARYDETMTDDQRAAFTNLILLCGPHHRLVDNIAPDDFPPDKLEAWKTQREGPALAGLRGLRGLTEERLSQMIEDVAVSVAPRREVVVELGGATRLPDGGAALATLEAWRPLLDSNPNLGGELMVVTTARNTGSLAASVDGFGLMFTFADSSLGTGPTAPEITLKGNNDYPSENPSLSAPLGVGNSERWFTKLSTVAWVAGRVADSERLRLAGFYATAELGSGETIRSPTYPVDVLPLDRLR